VGENWVTSALTEGIVPDELPLDELPLDELEELPPELLDVLELLPSAPPPPQALRPSSNRNTATQTPLRAG
jgi:hypothetical protein